MKHTQGFSLIELVLIVAIIGVLIAVLVPSLVQFRAQQALQHSTNAVVGVLDDARSKTLASINNTSHSVYLTSTSTTLITGTTYDSNAPTNQVYTLDPSVTLSWNLQGAGALISFDRLKGTINQYGTITITSSSGATRTVTVTLLGSIARN